MLWHPLAVQVMTHFISWVPNSAYFSTFSLEILIIGLSPSRGLTEQMTHVIRELLFLLSIDHWLPYFTHKRLPYIRVFVGVNRLMFCWPFWHRVIILKLTLFRVELRSSERSEDERSETSHSKTSIRFFWCKMLQRDLSILKSCCKMLHFLTRFWVFLPRFGAYLCEMGPQYIEKLL